MKQEVKLIAVTEREVIVFTREEFTKLYGEHPDWMWQMLQENYKRMALSERIRPNCEAAPWVIEEIKKLETENARLRKGQK